MGWSVYSSENKYKFENRKEIADYLLCVIGTGYSFVNGFIIIKQQAVHHKILPIMEIGKYKI
jgi:hypothetical protein